MKLLISTRALKTRVNPMSFCIFRSRLPNMNSKRHCHVFTCFCYICQTSSDGQPKGLQGSRMAPRTRFEQRISSAEPPHELRARHLDSNAGRQCGHFVIRCSGAQAVLPRPESSFGSYLVILQQIFVQYSDLA